jgi:hypothetical protein
VALDVYAGDFRILSTDSGNKDVTWTGGFQPDFIVFWWTELDSGTDTDGRGDTQCGWGFAVDSSTGVCAVNYDADNVGTTAGEHATDDSGVCIVTASSGAYTGSASLASTGWPATGFRLNITDSFPNNMYVHFLALGGTDISNVTCGTFATDYTQTPPYNIDTSVGFDPDITLFLPTYDDTIGAQTDEARIGMGVGRETSTEVGVSWAAEDGVGTTNTVGYGYNGEIACVWTGDVALRFNYLGHVVDNNFRISVLEQSGSENKQVLYAAIKMNTGAGTYLDVFNTRTDTNNIVRTGYGGQPSAVLCFSACQPNDTIDTLHDTARMSMGAATSASQQRAQGIFSEDNVATSVVVRSAQYDGLYIRPKYTSGVEQTTTVDYTGVKSAGSPAWTTPSYVASTDSLDAQWLDSDGWPSSALQIDVDDAPGDHNNVSINTVKFSVTWSLSATASRAKSLTLNWRKSDATLIHAYTTPTKTSTTEETHGDATFVTPTGTTALTDTEWDASYIEIIADEGGGKGDAVDVYVDYVKIEVKYDDNTGGPDHDGVMKLVSFDSGGATFAMNTSETDNAANQVAVLAFIPGKIDAEVTEPASVRIAQTGEVTDSASARIKLLSEATESASARIALPSEATSPASARLALQSENTEPGSVRLKVLDEITDTSTARIKLRAEETNVGTARIALPGQVNYPGSARVKVPSEVAEDASARISTSQPGEVTEDVSVRVKVLSEATDSASARLALPSEVTEPASVRTALQSEATEPASIRIDVSARIALPAEVTDDASARVAQTGEATDDVSARIALQSEVTDDVSARVALPSEATDDATARVAVPTEVTEAASIRTALQSQSTSAASVRIEIPATLEQEGYRWRDDDGSESAATWLQSQDVNLSRGKNVNTRLRVIVNANENPDSQQFQLEVRKQGVGAWQKIE